MPHLITDRPARSASATRVAERAELVETQARRGGERSSQGRTVHVREAGRPLRSSAAAMNIVRSELPERDSVNGYQNHRASAVPPIVRVRAAGAPSLGWGRVPLQNRPTRKVGNLVGNRDRGGPASRCGDTQLVEVRPWQGRVQGVVRGHVPPVARTERSPGELTPRQLPVRCPSPTYAAGGGIGPGNCTPVYPLSRMPSTPARSAVALPPPCRLRPPLRLVCRIGTWRGH